MDLRELTVRASEIQGLYRALNRQDGHAEWRVAEYTQGLVGDVGDLAKLIMAKNNFRVAENVDDKIAHELADCLWSVLVIANELDIDLQDAFLKTMNELDKKIG